MGVGWRGRVGVTSTAIAVAVVGVAGRIFDWVSVRSGSLWMLAAGSVLLMDLAGLVYVHLAAVAVAGEIAVAMVSAVH